MLKPGVPLWTVIVGMLLAIAVLVFMSREPRYEGRRLSQWMADLGIVSSPERLPRDEERRHRAQEAIRRIGPAAVPYLVHWIEYNRPAENIFVQLIRRLFPRNAQIQKTLPQRPPGSLSELQAYEAADALRLIHKVPDAAINRLGVLVRGGNGTVRNCATHALCGLAEHSPAAAVALVASDSAGLQIYGMEHLHKFTVRQVTPAVPSLRQCLTNRNVPVRLHATNALLRIAPQELTK